MIFNLCTTMQTANGVKVLALSLNEGTLTEKLREAGVETHVITESANTFTGIFIQALRLLKGRNVDVIHSHRIKENLLALLIAKFKGIKHLVTTVHGLPELILSGRKSAGSIKTKLNFFVLRHFFSSVIAVSADLKTILVSRYRLKDKRTEVIYNGIPLDETAQPRSENCDSSFRIGTVGRMVPVKDFGLFLEVAARLLRQGCDCSFSILGDGPLREKLAKKAASIGIEGSIDFLPSTEDPSPYYESLDLYLNTSLHEGIPLSLLEAMSKGKPVVAAKIGGIPEIISNGIDGFLIEGRKPSDFADTCARLIKDPELRARISANAIKKVSRSFKACKMAESYTVVYENLCYGQQASECSAISKGLNR